MAFPLDKTFSSLSPLNQQKPSLSLSLSNEAEDYGRHNSGVAMETEKKAELVSLLKVLPPVEFCCVYGSALHPNNSDKSSMVDYILGVSNPLQWHTERREDSHRF